MLKSCDPDCVPGKAEEECLHPEHLYTGVGTFSGVKAKPESVMYNNTNTAWTSQTKHIVFLKKYHDTINAFVTQLGIYMRDYRV